MKKVFSLLLIFSVLFSFAGCSEQTPSQNQPVDSEPTVSEVKEIKTDSGIENKVRQLGRTAITAEGIWTSWSGSGVEFEFSGSKATATLKANLVFGEEHKMLVGVFIDGEEAAQKTFQISSQPQEITICENLKNSKHTVKILKLSEAQYGSVCIKDIKAEGMVATASKKLTFEFIGDSVVCGNGTRAKSSRGEFKTVEQDVSLTAGYLLAQAYDADFRFICATDYNVDKTSSGGKVISEIYTKNTPFLADQIGIQDSDYTFSSPADVIFINVGNDRASKITTVEQREVFKSQYEAFIRLVRQKNPNAEIFVLCGTLTYLLESETAGVAARFKDDEKLHYYRYSFESMLVYSGITAGYPSAHSNTRMKKELLKEMKSLGIKP